MDGVKTIDTKIEDELIHSALDDDDLLQPMKGSYVLTTVDNPYSPIDEFDKWFAYDEVSGYCTCGLLSRTIDALRNYYNNNVTLTSPTEDELTELAIDKIVTLNVSGMHQKIWQPPLHDPALDIKLPVEDK